MQIQFSNFLLFMVGILKGNWVVNRRSDRVSLTTATVTEPSAVQLQPPRGGNWASEVLCHVYGTDDGKCSWAECKRLLKLVYPIEGGTAYAERCMIGGELGL